MTQTRCTCDPEHLADQHVPGRHGADGAAGRQGVGAACGEGAQLDAPLAGAINDRARAAGMAKQSVLS